jgi:hypothetical protein
VPAIVYWIIMWAFLWATEGDYPGQCRWWLRDFRPLAPAEIRHANNKTLSNGLYPRVQEWEVPVQLPPPPWWRDRQ